MKDERLTHILLIFVMGYGVLNCSSMERSMILSLANFVITWAWYVCLLDLAGCLAVVRLVHVQKGLCLLLEDGRHRLAS